MLTENKLKFGWSDQQLLNAIGSEAVATAQGGAQGIASLRQGSVAAGLRTSADNYAQKVDPAMLDMWTEEILKGTKTETQFTEQMKLQASQQYRSLAPQIEKDQTVKEAVTMYSNAAQNVLGIDPSTIDWTQDKWGKALNYKPQSVGQVHIPPMRASHFEDYNPRPVGITCTGTADAPNFFITTPDYDMEIRNINPASIKINAIKQTSAGSHQVVPQIFDFTFDLEAGNYTPQELGKAITNKVNNLEKNGNVYGETDSSQDKYPVNSPFLTTVVQNDFKIKAEGLAAKPAYVTDQVFVSSTLGVFNPKLDGKLYFSYPVNNMVNNAQADPYRPEMDRFVGTNEIAIEFDDGEQKLKVTAQHFPIYNNLTEVATANDALPAVAYNITETAADFEVTTGLVTRYSGIAWTSLTAIDKKTKKPTSFWNDIGFTNMCVQPTSKGIRMDYGGVVPTEDNSFTVTATDGVNITGGYAGLDVPVIKNNITYTTPYANNTQISYVGTSITSSLFANRVFNSAPESEGYYLIEIGTNFKQEFIGGSATYMSGVQSIVNRYFTQNSFTSDQGAGSISYIHSGVSQSLTEFNIRVLNPNFMVPAETQLGPKNTIFIQVIKPKKINQ